MTCLCLSIILSMTLSIKNNLEISWKIRRNSYQLKLLSKTTNKKKYSTDGCFEKIYFVFISARRCFDLSVSLQKSPLAISCCLFGIIAIYAFIEHTCQCRDSWLRKERWRSKRGKCQSVFLVWLMSRDDGRQQALRLFTVLKLFCFI